MYLRWIIKGYITYRRTFMPPLLFIECSYIAAVLRIRQFWPGNNRNIRESSECTGRGHEKSIVNTYCLLRLVIDKISTINTSLSYSTPEHCTHKSQSERLVRYSSSPALGAVIVKMKGPVLGTVCTFGIVVSHLVWNCGYYMASKAMHWKYIWMDYCIKSQCFLATRGPAVGCHLKWAPEFFPHF